MPWKRVLDTVRSKRLLHVFCRLAVLKTFAKLTREHSRRRRFHCSYFPVNFVKFFLISYLLTTLRLLSYCETLLVRWISTSVMSWIYPKLTHFMPLVSFDTLWKHQKTTLENQRFSDVFRGYRKRWAAWNELIVKILEN